MDIYLKNTNSFSFPSDWKQSFLRPFTALRPVNEAVALRSFIGIESEKRDMGFEILIFLYECTFATKEQFKKLLKIKGFDVSELDAVLEEYVSLCFLNLFTLSIYEMDEIPEDALIIYCLDYSARFILDHYYQEGIATLWKSTNSLRGSEIVAKHLVAAELCLSLKATKPKSLRYYQAPASFFQRRKELQLSARFGILKGSIIRDVIVEIIRHSELPLSWQCKVNEQLGPFLHDTIREGSSDLCWSKYFDLEPALILLAENLEQATEAAKIYYLSVKNTNFRVTTDAELMKGIDKTQFYKFDAGKKTLLPAGAASLFSPD